MIVIPDCFQIDHLEKEADLLRQSAGSNVVYKGIDLPEGIAPSSACVINSQNEYLIHLLQVLKMYVLMTVLIVFLNLVYEFLGILRINKNLFDR